MFSAIALVGQGIGPAGAGVALAQDANAELAKKLSNPASSLISVPFQFNYDRGFGPEHGDRKRLDIQPVIPFSLNADWNVISRTVVPIIWQHDIAGPSGHQSALNTESTYDWEAEQWSVPVNFQVSKLVKFGAQPVSLSAGRGRLPPPYPSLEIC